MSEPVEVGLIAAMEREIKPLVSDWQRESVESGNGTQVFYRSGGAVAVCSGPTKQSARAATKVLVERYAPRLLLSVGFAGALSASLKVADLVVPEQVIDAGTGRAFDTGNGSGVLVTADHVVGRDAKRNFAERLHGVAVDMEAAAVAEVAEGSGCGFAAVKAISDDANAEMDFVGRFVTSSRFSTGAFLAYVAPRPWLWSTVHHLRINSERASSNLCSALKYILGSKDGVTGALAAMCREHVVSTF